MNGQTGSTRSPPPHQSQPGATGRLQLGEDVRCPAGPTIAYQRGGAAGGTGRSVLNRKPVVSFHRPHQSVEPLLTEHLVESERRPFIRRGAPPS